MDERDYLILLYDFYGELFQERQKEYFESYYFQNLSLSEIGNNLGVSRNAVHKALRGMEEKLNFYEEKLAMFKMNMQICDIIKENDSDMIKKKLEELVRGDEICGK